MQNQKTEKENKDMENCTIMEKEIKEIENKYSLYFNMKRKFDYLYRVFTTVMLVIMALCLYDISEMVFEILELFVK